METLLLKRIFEELLLTRRTPSYIAAYYTNRHLSIDDSNKSVESALARFECSTLSDHEGSRTVVLRDNHICECVIHHYDGHIVPPKDSGELYPRAKNPSNKLLPNDDFVINLILIK